MMTIMMLTDTLAEFLTSVFATIFFSNNKQKMKKKKKGKGKGNEEEKVFFYLVTATHKNFQL